MNLKVIEQFLKAAPMDGGQTGYHEVTIRYYNIYQGGFVVRLENEGANGMYSTESLSIDRSLETAIENLRYSSRLRRCSNVEEENLGYMPTTDGETCFG